ncbi:hypothetical protein FF011L_37580 [Roseimaritima multifibrata]|uniref:Chromosome partition protein Smc n=1 Tax=Roseimaritima multifibrata TaxID=1930274 RepID=A0A517MJE2_9BACT|nr:hypothetical protein [Roseimaritima multifibrata]QDS94974.1 hypothetical protein FF011L_37580 [Roseimaritima multifibrata]
MNQIETQVKRARRRLMLQTFGRVISWTLFAGLMLAFIGIALPKIWALAIDVSAWNAAWLGGAFAVGLISAVAWTYFKGPSDAETASEIDRRFALRERLSSSLAMRESERKTKAGQALVADAEQRAKRIAIPDRFGLRPAKLGLLPLIPLALLAVLIFIPNATRENELDASALLAAKQEAEQVQRTAKILKKKIQEARDQAKEKGLTDVEDLFKQLDRKLDKITKREKTDRKEAMIALNDLKDTLAERREKLGSPDKMRKSLSNLENMEKGPADRVAKSLQQGDFGKAQDEIKNLAQKMRDGNLNEEEKKKLKAQIEQMKDLIEKAAQKHEQDKQKLQEQIEEAKSQGRQADADKLQQKLNEMNQQQDQMDRMQKLAEGLGKASDAMQKGDSQSASEALEAMADELGEMQQELDELESLDDAMEQLSQSKDQMRCQQCQGNGCQQCQGMGMGKSEKPGNGLGEGEGFGDRPESEDDTNTYETQVRGKPQKGRGIIAGVAGGENKKGVSREELQESVRSAISEESDAVENQSLPRTERAHAQQYLDLLREGN